MLFGSGFCDTGGKHAWLHTVLQAPASPGSVVVMGGGAVSGHSLGFVHAVCCAVQCMQLSIEKRARGPAVHLHQFELTGPVCEGFSSVPLVHQMHVQFALG